MKAMVKSLIKKLVPESVINTYRLNTNRNKSAKEVFTDIYLNGKWGRTNEQKFCSGYGSSGEIASAYARFVNEFIAKNNVRSIVDLGCGDFQIGRLLNLEGRQYTGGDIVEPLIQHNRGQFETPNIRFQIIDMINDNELPDGELCTIRQVLQHLSNESIQRVLPKLKKYKYVLFTDQVAKNEPFDVNPNIPNFSGTRFVMHKAGLRLENPPFNLPVQTVFEYENKEHDPDVGSMIRTVVYRPGDAIPLQ